MILGLRRLFVAAALGALSWAAPAANAADPPAFDSGRLLATSGITQLEGAAGGGLAPWAVIAGYGTRDSIGATASGTVVRVSNYTLGSFGAEIGLYDRVELSYAKHVFDTRSTGRALGLGAGFTFRQDVLGAKIRLFGDAVNDQDTLLPQVAVGVQYKLNDRRDVLRAIGAKGSQGVDFYASATKLFLAESLLLNATLRLTKANQLGILGFGGDRNNGYRPEFEGSAAVLLSRHIAVGAEYRTKPDNLRFARESDWYDLFVAYFPTKNVSATLAYVDLGSVAGRKNQTGLYASLQIGF